MRADAFFEAVRCLPLATPSAITGDHPWVVLSPHPDDESLGAGGLIAAASAAGIWVDVVILTDGSGSHPGSTAYPRDALVALRRAEAERAAELLGVPPHRQHHLGIVDTQAPAEGAAFDDVVDRLQAIIETTGARSLFVTWGHDPHCDHKAADAMARDLRRRIDTLKLWSYPIWGWHLEPNAEIDAPTPEGVRIDITLWHAAKQAAIAAHASQMTDLIDDDPDGFRFTACTIAPFVGRYEYFFEVPA